MPCQSEIKERDVMTQRALTVAIDTKRIGNRAMALL
jgi:hypothetical protein